jgi:hypothetical protein
MSAPPLAQPRLSRRQRLLLRGVVLPLSLLWAFGAVGFLSADGTLQLTLPRRAAAPRGEHNLVSYQYGPTIRASSYFRDPGSHHHPMFLVDGLRKPSPIEKWASARRDRAPWVALSWAEPRTISRVVVHHVRAHEAAPSSLRDYTLSCASDSARPTRLTVQNNLAAVAVHALRCDHARGLRLDCRLRDEDIARIYEIEVWGQ